MKEIETPIEYSDICPFSDKEFHSKMEQLVAEAGFKHAVTWVMPDIDYDGFCKTLLSIESKQVFQEQVMFGFLEMLAAKTTDGISCDGAENVDRDNAYTMITNHRDIVLDASFLNLSLIKNHCRTTEVAIGSNLLIYDWIENLVRLNKSVIVKRDVGMRHALEAAEQLSGYIHFAINQKNESVWIAQRQGRAKDSSDTTQESLIKMLAIKGDGSLLDNILSLNLMPVSISYELDPNDYLKARISAQKERPGFQEDTARRLVQHGNRSAPKQRTCPFLILRMHQPGNRETTRPRQKRTSARHLPDYRPSYPRKLPDVSRQLHRFRPTV